MAYPFMTGPFVPVAMLNLIRAVLGIHHHRFNLSVKRSIVTFWHIPWPNAETFGICPWKGEIIAGLLGSSVLGFHTQFHCNNFIETVDRFIESRIDRELASVTVSGHETFVRPYPISIEWPPAALADQKSVAACRSSVCAKLGLSESIRIGVGVERFDYTKGII